MTASDAQPAAFGTTPASAGAGPRPGVRLPAPRRPARPRPVRPGPLLYAVLLDYARQDGHCYPGTERLRADLGCGHNQLARAVRELEAGGLVARRRRGFGKTTVYHLLPLPGTAAGRPPGRGPPARPERSRPSSARPRAPSAPPERAPRAPRIRRPTERPGPGRSGPRPRGPRRRGPTPATATGAAPARADHAGDGTVLLPCLVEQGVTPPRRRGSSPGCTRPRWSRRQVDCHRHRVAASGLTRNPAGALVRAIREDWAPPAAWAAARSRRRRPGRPGRGGARRREEEDAAPPGVGGEAPGGAHRRAPAVLGPGPAGEAPRADRGGDRRPAGRAARRAGRPGGFMPARPAAGWPPPRRHARTPSRDRVAVRATSWCSPGGRSPLPPAAPSLRPARARSAGQAAPATDGIREQFHDLRHGLRHGLLGERPPLRRRQLGGQLRHLLPAQVVADGQSQVPGQGPRLGLRPGAPGATARARAPPGRASRPRPATGAPPPGRAGGSVGGPAGATSSTTAAGRSRRTARRGAGQGTRPTRRR